MPAGYLFTFSDERSMLDCMASGIYSTLVNCTWSNAVSATLADYVTMKPGDNVYFFSNRKVYGIGELTSVVPGCIALENYPGATSKEKVDYAVARESGLIDPGSGERTKRWLTAFRPAPFLFSEGIDMDDLLAMDDGSFKSLRVFWKRSFIKLDEQENAAFKAALLRRNIDVLSGSKTGFVSCESERSSAALKERAKDVDRSIDVPGLLARSRKSDGSLSSEMLLEVGILSQLVAEDQGTLDAFGKWDYLSHQVHASPMKPVDYMDKIDIFGYRWIPSFEPIVEKYLVMELKKGLVSGQDISQVMKYVDWVHSEYAKGDYSMVKAFLVGHRANAKGIAAEIASAERRYIVGARPAVSRVWNALEFVTYHVEPDGHIVFSRVDLHNRARGERV